MNILVSWLPENKQPFLGENVRLVTPRWWPEKVATLLIALIPPHLSLGEAEGEELLLGMFPESTGGLPSLSGSLGRVDGGNPWDISWNFLFNSFSSLPWLCVVNHITLLYLYFEFKLWHYFICLSDVVLHGLENTRKRVRTERNIQTTCQFVERLTVFQCPFLIL